MCSYSDYVEQKSFEKANVKVVAKLVHSKVMDMEAALDLVEVPNDERPRFTQRVEQELHAQNSQCSSTSAHK